MHVLIGSSETQLAPLTSVLLRRMFCPLSGLSQQIGFVMRSGLEPKIAVAGGDMTGVHILRGLPPPQPGAYHIGGSGTTYAEAIIGALGETVERYAQYSSASGGHNEVVSASYQQLLATGKRVLVTEGLQYFSPSQLDRPGFPCARLEPDMVIGWVAAKSLIDNAGCWVPAQLALVGYARQAGEAPFMIGVTTGTAAHTRPAQAARNALLELIQIDSAMGHWYGRQAAVQIGPGARTEAVTAVIGRHLRSGGPVPHFYWLPNADLPGLAIACVIEDQDVPRMAVGLGCDLRLNRAMYKAFLEGVAVAQLAKVILFRQAMDELPTPTDPAQIYDLDSNVAYYAAQPRPALQAKFSDSPKVDPAGLPADIDFGVTGDLRHLVKSFQDTGKELVALDLTTCDIRELGFYVLRLWSPDMLSLSLPSAPPLLHPRFQAYGGVAHEAPHPYP